METTQGTYALGGYGSGYRSEVLHLDCAGDQIKSCQWQEMPEKLEVGRSYHVSLSLPESYEICSGTRKNHFDFITISTVLSIVFIFSWSA